MSGFIERIIEEHSFGPDRPDRLDIAARATVLTTLQSLPVSKEYSQDSFLPHTYLRDLIETADDGSCVEASKFDRFLRDQGIGLTQGLVWGVVKLLAYPTVYGREIGSQFSMPKISDAQQLVETGEITKLDGFNIPFNLEVAKKLFALK